MKNRYRWNSYMKRWEVWMYYDAALYWVEAIIYRRKYEYIQIANNPSNIIVEYDDTWAEPTHGTVVNDLLDKYQ